MPAQIFPLASFKRHFTDFFNQDLQILYEYSSQTAGIATYCIPGHAFLQHLHYHNIATDQSHNYESLPKQPDPQFLSMLSAVLDQHIDTHYSLWISLYQYQVQPKIVTLDPPTAQQLFEKILAIWQTYTNQHAQPTTELYPLLTVQFIPPSSHSGTIKWTQSGEAQVQIVADPPCHMLSTQKSVIELPASEHAPHQVPTDLVWTQIQSLSRQLGQQESIEQAYWFQLNDHIVIQSVAHKSQSSKEYAESGIPASPGLATGLLNRLDQPIGDQDIAYLASKRHLDLNDIPKFVGLVLESASPTHPASIIARLHHLPVVSGVCIPPTVGRDLITIDGNQGKVYLTQTPPTNHDEDFSHTNTELLYSDEQHGFFQPVPSYVQGHFIESLTKLYPEYLDPQSSSEYYSAKLAEVVLQKASQLEPRPVIVAIGHHPSQLPEKFPDIFTPSYTDNGRRQVNLQQLQLEVQALAHARDTGQANLHLLLPPVVNSDQLKQIKKDIYHFGLKRTANLYFYLHVHSASTLFTIQEYYDVGLDGIVVNIDQISQSFLNQPLQTSHADQTALHTLIHQSIKITKQQKLHSYIYGQLIHESPDLVQKLVKWKVTGLISSHYHAPRIKQDIKRNEVNLSKNKHRLRKK